MDTVPLTGYLCEQCLDAPAVAFVPAPGGGEMGVCAACGAPAVRSTYECWRHPLDRAHSPVFSRNGILVALTCGLCGLRCVTTAGLWEAELTRRRTQAGPSAPEEV